MCSLVSLGRRCGAGSSQVLWRAFTDNRGAVREYAADALLEVADDRIWDDVCVWYEQWLAKPKSRRRPIPPAMPLSYLVIHAAGHAERRDALVALIRRNWSRLLPFEQQWIRGQAPDAGPDGPPGEAVRLPGRNDLPLTASDLHS